MFYNNCSILNILRPKPLYQNNHRPGNLHHHLDPPSSIAEDTTIPTHTDPSTSPRFMNNVSPSLSDIFDSPPSTNNISIPTHSDPSTSLPFINNVSPSLSDIFDSPPPVDNLFLPLQPTSPIVFFSPSPDPSPLNVSSSSPPPPSPYNDQEAMARRT
ncbi:hypothetical protein BC941DRAFT_218918 [Chlamydoabsidia padenii]|nr:hypothetical protein BC941DRAFT_218918 [Chlamydoabsidia padenii]